MLCVPAVEWNWCKTQIPGGSLLGVASILHPVCVLSSWEKENPDKRLILDAFSWSKVWKRARAPKQRWAALSDYKARNEKWFF